MRSFSESRIKSDTTGCDGPKVGHHPTLSSPPPEHSETEDPGMEGARRGVRVR